MADEENVLRVKLTTGDPNAESDGPAVKVDFPAPEKVEITHAVLLPACDLNAEEDAVVEAIWEALDHHMEMYDADKIPHYACSCGYKPDVQKTAMSGDLVFQHIASSVSEAAVNAMRSA